MTEDDRVIEETVFCTDLVTEDSTFPKLLKDIPAWALALLEEVPKEYREGVTVEFSNCYSEYDDAYISVSYYRPETAEEAVKRLAEYNARVGEWRTDRYNSYLELKMEFEK